VNDAEPGLIKDEITLPDGRYLIYYTFDDSDVILSLSKDEPAP
jgi:hypothetical protein